jgi:hypothetical protein
MKQHIRSITTQRKWGRQRSASGSAPQVSAPGVTKIGYQLWVGDYWADAIYADLMRTATPDWSVLYQPGYTTVGVDQYGWLDALPANTTYVNVVTTQQGSATGYERRGGVYVATWTPGPNNVQVRLTGNHLESCLSGGHEVSPGRYEITLSQTAPGSNGGNAWILNAEVSHSGAGTAVLNDLKVFHIQDEARINAGQVLTSKHADKLSGCGAVRLYSLMAEHQDSYGWSYLDTSHKADDVVISNWNTLQHRIWRGDKMPPEVGAMIANELNSDLYLTMPALTTEATHLEYAQKVYSVLNSSLRVHLECANEVWNYTIPYAAASSYLGHIVGPTLTGVVNTNGAAADDFFSRVYCADLYVSAKMWRKWEEVFPRNRVVRVLAGWSAGVGSNNDGHAALRYIDPVSGLSGAQIADEFTIAPYMDRRAGETAKEMKNARRHEETDLTFMYDMVRASISPAGSAVLGHKAKLAAIAPGVKLSTYEGGYEITWDMNYNGGAAWTINSEAAGDTLGNNINGFDWALSDGEQIRVSNVGASGLDEHTLYYVKLPTSTSIRVYSTLTNYNNNTYVALTDATGIDIQNYSRCDGYVGFMLTSDNTINAYTNETFADSFDTGEEIQVVSGNGASLYYGVTYYIRKVSADKFTVHATLADATNNTNILSLSGGNNAMIQFDNYSRMKILAEQCYSMITSQFGADLYNEYFNTAMDGNVELIMQHVPFGNIYELRTTAVLKQAWSAYSPQMTAMRALAIARKGSV